jgi:hypothetical protein
MIELLSNQTSGNDWGPPDRTMLHERQQETSAQSLPHNQRLIFKDLERQMARFEADHVAMIADVRKHYVIPSHSSVSEFLNSHRTLSALLLQAIPNLREHFGADAVFSLRSPVDDSGTQTLYAVVMWPGGVKEVKAALDRFDDAWWIPNSLQASGYLTFTYELI